MEQNFDNCDFGFKDANVKILQKATDNIIKSKNCNQFDYASSHTGNLRIDLKMHRREKSNKCNQCNFASSQAGNLRTHSKAHSGDKLNKCNQCDFAYSQPSSLKTHLKTHIRGLI